MADSQPKQRDYSDRMVYNDFACTEIPNGFRYIQEQDDGHAECIIRFFEPGIGLMKMDFNTSHVTNRDRIGDMNLIMFHFALSGRICTQCEQHTMSTCPGMG